jgi:hypothetical protein
VSEGEEAHSARARWMVRATRVFIWLKRAGASIYTYPPPSSAPGGRSPGKKGEGRRYAERKREGKREGRAEGNRDVLSQATSPARRMKVTSAAKAQVPTCEDR